MQNGLARGQRHGDPGAAERFELDGGLTVRGIGQEHRHLVAHPQHRHRLVPPKDRFGERSGDIEIDHVVRQLDEGDVERLRQRPAELLLGDHSHREQHFAEPAPAQPLTGQRLLELLARHELSF